jgi:ribonuclease E
MWLLVGAIAAAGVVAGLRWTSGRTGAPVTRSAVVDVLDEAAAAESRAVVEPIQSAAPSSSPAEAEAVAEAVSEAPKPVAPPAASRPALRRSPPVPARVVKKPARKQAIAHRAPAAAKPAPARQSTGRSESRPTQSPLVRPGWRDPFQ